MNGYIVLQQTTLYFEWKKGNAKKKKKNNTKYKQNDETNVLECLMDLLKSVFVFAFSTRMRRKTAHSIEWNMCGIKSLTLCTWT